MELIFKKLREARLYLNLRQTDVEAVTGLSQHLISRIETGERFTVPLAYWKFLLSKKIDIAGIIDDSVSLEAFRKTPRNTTLNIVAELTDAKTRIQAQDDVINNYSKMINTLQEKLDLKNYVGKKGRAVG